VSSLRGPPLRSVHRCLMSFSQADDRVLAYTQAPQSRVVTCSSEEALVIAHDDLRGTGGTGREQRTEVTSHHTFFNSVHVARSTTKTRWHLRFFVYVKTFKTPTLLHCFITSLNITQAFPTLETLSILLRTPLPPNPNLFKGTIFTS